MFLAYHYANFQGTLCDKFIILKCVYRKVVLKNHSRLQYIRICIYFSTRICIWILRLKWAAMRMMNVVLNSSWNAMIISAMVSSWLWLCCILFFAFNRHFHFRMSFLISYPKNYFPLYMGIWYYRYFYWNFIYDNTKKHQYFKIGIVHVTNIDMHAIWRSM